MVLLTTLDERRRRSRNVVFAAFILLVTIWTLKLIFPRTTIITIFSTRQPPPHESEYVELEPISSSTESERWKAKPEVDLTLSESFNGTIGNKAAVIVETKFRSNMIPLILHYGSVLGPTWPLIIYSSAESVGLFSTSAALGRYLKSGSIEIRVLPNTILFVDKNAIDTFMTGPWLWTNLAPIEHILLFDGDSMVCANAARSVDDYIEYDFIGSPVVGDKASGGLSLRKRSTVMRVLENWDWMESYGLTDPDKPHEDQWFYKKMIELKEGDDLDSSEEGAIELPTVDVAKTFSVASFDFPHPLGVHGVLAWAKDATPALDDWCPEYKLCSGS